MPREIERKFLLKSLPKYLKNTQRISQAYLPVAANAPFVARVRLANEKAYLCLKGQTSGLERPEYEYEIPFGDAEEIIGTLKTSGAEVIEKTRYIAEYGGYKWEIDVFHGKNEGLAVAEIELSAADEDFAKPDWLGTEVTADRRYYNANLAKNPYCDWKEA